MLFAPTKRASWARGGRARPRASPAPTRRRSRAGPPCGRRRARSDPRCRRRGSAGRSSRTRASPGTYISRRYRKSRAPRPDRDRGSGGRRARERDATTHRPGGVGMREPPALLQPHAERAEPLLGECARASAAGTVSVFGYQRSARSHSRWFPRRPATAIGPRRCRSSSIHVSWARVPHQTYRSAGVRVLELAREQRAATLELPEHVSPEARLLLRNSIAQRSRL